ncbi:sugar-binding transcriptional regulator [Devriesea agamarum]|uniref:sugar-binding transcriptional regulator n=1 Tax=Devriesea agamarum TaxID=472569 RepID=UPI000A51626A|nr:sugar-binding domain-containing protein [Devriesea agamarum]
MITRTATMEERHHISLLLDVARLYYENNLSQGAIAQRIGYSRPTVSRLLAEARRRGIVTVHISHPLERVLTVEEALTRQFGLKAVRVAESGGAMSTPTAVARCAADLVIESTQDDVVLAISNGMAVAATVDAMPKLERTQSRVVQMIGSVGRSDTLLDSPEACRRMAAKLGGRYHALPVPLVVASSALAIALRQEDQVATTLELAARADVALVGIGAVLRGRSGHIFDGHENVEMSAHLTHSQAVGHICGHHFAADGSHVDTPLCARTISVDPSRMRSIPLVIGVAWGREKVEAIRAAIAGGFVSALVTDRETAVELLVDDTQR